MSTTISQLNIRSNLLQYIFIAINVLFDLFLDLASCISILYVYVYWYWYTINLHSTKNRIRITGETHNEQNLWTQIVLFHCTKHKSYMFKHANRISIPSCRFEFKGRKMLLKYSNFPSFCRSLAIVYMLHLVSYINYQRECEWKILLDRLVAWNFRNWNNIYSKKLFPIKERDYFKLSQLISVYFWCKWI